VRTVGNVQLGEDVRDVVADRLVDLGDSPDATYLADPRWPVVVDTARDALKALGARP